jgi:hypothetical protein
MFFISFVVYGFYKIQVHLGLVIATFPQTRYRYILGLLISKKKWPRPGPRYPCSVRITRYVHINFVPILNQTNKEGSPVIRTVPIIRTLVKYRLSQVASCERL